MPMGARVSAAADGRRQGIRGRRGRNGRVRTRDSVTMYRRAAGRRTASQPKREAGQESLARNASRTHLVPAWGRSPTPPPAAPRWRRTRRTPSFPRMKNAGRTPRIPLTRRAAALLATVLFLFAWSGDAFGYHPCAHHSALAPHVGAHAESHAAPAPAAAAHDAHAGHHASPAPATETGAERAAPADAPHDGACLCVGGCPVAGASLPSSVEIAVATLDEADASPQHDAPAALLPRLRPHVLPFAQGPPSLS